MNKIFNFKKNIKGFNKIKVKASTIILFLFAIIASMNSWLTGNFYFTKLFIITFLIDFTIKIFINPKYSPTLILVRLFIKNQKSKYANSPQKRFVWRMVFLLSLIINLTLLTGCSLNSTTNQDNQQNNSYKELSTEEFGKMISNFKNKVNDDINSTEEKIDNKIEGEENSKEVKNFLEEFKKTINSIETEQNEEDSREMINEMLNDFNDDINSLIKDDLSSDQKNTTEKNFEDQLKEALMEDDMDKMLDKSAKKIKEFMDIELAKDKMEELLEQEEFERTQKEAINEILKEFKKMTDNNFEEIMNNFIKKNSGGYINKKEFGCENACKMYYTCAGFGEDVGEKGMQEAYISCFQECQKWSTKTLSCMKKIKEIKSPMDCAPLTMCALSEYN